MNTISGDRRSPTYPEQRTLCNQLKFFLNKHPFLFGDNNNLVFSDLVTSSTCKDKEETVVKKEISEKRKFAVLEMEREGKEDTQSFQFSEVKKDKGDIVLVDKDNSARKEKITLLNDACLGFWRFQKKRESLFSLHMLIGNEKFYFRFPYLNIPECRIDEESGETRIYLNYEKKNDVQCATRKVALKGFKSLYGAEETRKLCGSHIKVAEGKNGCTINGVESKFNCYTGTDLDGRQFWFLSDQFKKVAEGDPNFRQAFKDCTIV